MQQNIIKHAVLWIVFSFFYVSGLDMALTLAIDGQQYPTLVNTLLYTFLFNLLVGHLITKYEKLWPFICAVIVSSCGVIGFGTYFGESLVQYSMELRLAQVLSLPFATFVVIEIKKWMAKQQ